MQSLCIQSPILLIRRIATEASTPCFCNVHARKAQVDAENVNAATVVKACTRKMGEKLISPKYLVQMHMTPAAKLCCHSEEGPGFMVQVVGQQKFVDHFSNASMPWLSENPTKKDTVPAAMLEINSDAHDAHLNTNMHTYVCVYI